MAERVPVRLGQTWGARGGSLRARVTAVDDHYVTLEAPSSLTITPLSVFHEGYFLVADSAAPLPSKETRG